MSILLFLRSVKLANPIICDANLGELLNDVNKSMNINMFLSIQVRIIMIHDVFFFLLFNENHNLLT